MTSLDTIRELAKKHLQCSPHPLYIPWYIHRILYDEDGTSAASLASPKPADGTSYLNAEPWTKEKNKPAMLDVIQVMAEELIGYLNTHPASAHDTETTLGITTPDVLNVTVCIFKEWVWMLANQTMYNTTYSLDHLIKTAYGLGYGTWWFVDVWEQEDPEFESHYLLGGYGITGYSEFHCYVSNVVTNTEISRLLHGRD
jgi:hypothetical protein